MIIDLDAVPAAPARPVRPSPRAASALVVLLAALLLGPAQPLRPVPEPQRVATTRAASGAWLLTGDTLYSTRTLARNRLDVVAHDLTTDQARWQRQIEWYGGMPILTSSGSILVVSGDDGNSPLVADTRTGADVTENVETALPAGDRIVLWQSDDDERLGLREPAAATTTWWRPYDQLPIAVAADDDHLVVLDETGGATTFRTGDGRELGHTDQASDGGGLPGVRIIGGQAYVFGERSLTALRLPDLAHLWSVPAVLPKHVDGCGTRICVTSGAGLHAHDPADGSVTWTDVHWTGWTGGFALANDGRVVLLDPETGALRTSLGTGLPLDDLLLRRSGDGVHLIDWRTGQTRGAIPGEPSTICRRSGTRLACQRSDGLIQVWRLP